MGYTTIEACNNVIVLENKEDYEKHLINNGYENEIVEAIGEIEGNPNYVLDYFHTQDHSFVRREKTDLPKCPSCQQFIFRDVIRDYSGTDGWRNAIYDCCTAKHAKAKYAIGVAEKIVSIPDTTRRIPPKIKSLLEKMDVN